MAGTETFEFVPEQDVFKANEVLGDSTNQAMRAAHAWLDGQGQQERHDVEMSR